VGLLAAEPDVPWIEINFGGTTPRFVRFVTADQPMIAIARTIEEDGLLPRISSPDSSARGLHRLT
jgi:hypothetical protein